MNETSTVLGHQNKFVDLLRCSTSSSVVHAQCVFLHIFFSPLQLPFLPFAWHRPRERHLQLELAGIAQTICVSVTMLRDLQLCYSREFPRRQREASSESGCISPALLHCLHQNLKVWVARTCTQVANHTTLVKIGTGVPLYVC